MSDDIAIGGWAVAMLLGMWVALLKFMLGKYVKTIEDNTKKLAALDVRLARIEGRLGLKRETEDQ